MTESLSLQIDDTRLSSSPNRVSPIRIFVSGCRTEGVRFPKNASVILELIP